MKNRTLSQHISISLFYLILLIEYRFFFLFKIPDDIQRFMTYHNKILLLLISFVFLIFCGLFVKKQLFSSSISVFIVMIFLSSFYAYKTYHPQLTEILIPAVAYLTIILYFPLKNLINYAPGKCIKTLTTFNLLACLILLLQYVVYKISGSVFLKVYEFYQTGIIAVRNDSIRITFLGTIVSISCILSIGILINGSNRLSKKMVFHFVNIVFSILYFYLVSQTRMYVFSIGLTIVLQCLFVLKNSNNKILKYFLLWTSIALIFYGSGLFGYMINVIQPLKDGTYVSDGSYYARLDAIALFSETVKNKPLTGNGLFDPREGNNYLNLIRGSRGQSFYSDVGILGVAAQFGLPMIFWFIYILFKIYRLRTYTNNSIINSLFLFLIISTPTLIVLDPQRMLFLTACLAIVDSIVVKYNNDILKEGKFISS